MAEKTTKTIKTTKKKSKAKVEEVINYTPLDHVLVPKSEQATEDELKTLAVSLGITRDKLPLINSKDASIAYLKLRPGDVVKFTRKSLINASENPYYRLVIGE